MIFSSQTFLFKKISTSLALFIIIFLAAVVGALAIYKSQQLKKLAQLPVYVQLNRALSSTTTDWR